MNKPWYQKIFVSYVPWVLAGFIFIGSVLNTVSNTRELITPTLTWIGTLVVLLIAWTVVLWLKYKPVLWVTGAGQQSYIKSLGWKPLFLTVGIIVPLWIPRFINVRNDSAKLSSMVMHETLSPPRFVITSRGGRTKLSITPESGPPGTEFKIELLDYELGGPFVVELVAPEPCNNIIETRHINADRFGTVRQSFTSRSSSPSPGSYNPCLLGIYKAVFTSEYDNESLAVHFTVIDPVQ
jgi:hypothetical protein